MGQRLVYNGASSKADTSSEFHIRDEDRKMHVLRQGQPSDELPDSLASELLEGSDRTKGHKFDAATDEQLQAAGIDVDKPSTTTDAAPADAGGPGGTTPSGGSAGGTAAATARTGR